MCSYIFKEKKKKIINNFDYNFIIKYLFKLKFYNLFLNYKYFEKFIIVVCLFVDIFGFFGKIVNIIVISFDNKKVLILVYLWEIYCIMY